MFMFRHRYANPSPIHPSYNYHAHIDPLMHTSVAILPRRSGRSHRKTNLGSINDSPRLLRLPLRWRGGARKTPPRVHLTKKMHAALRPPPHFLGGYFLSRPITPPRPTTPPPAPAQPHPSLAPPPPPPPTTKQPPPPPRPPPARPQTPPPPPHPCLSPRPAPSPSPSPHPPHWAQTLRKSPSHTPRR